MNDTVVSSSLLADEIDRFNAVSSTWWDTSGPFKQLHLMNPSRLEFIRDGINSTHGKSKQLPLQGLRILDVGCGGGILCEPLARMGATVTGIDASDQAINVATNHAAVEDLALTYCQSTIEDFQENEFDVICALEILEHVHDPASFIAACVERLKPGGLLFISTLNRNLESYLKAIVLAEHVLKWVPKGTHTWNKFIKPAELGMYLRQANASLRLFKGMAYNPLKQTWALSHTIETNYIAMAIKS